MRFKLWLVFLLSIFLMPIAQADYWNDPNFTYESGYLGLLGGTAHGGLDFRARTTTPSGIEITDFQQNFSDLRNASAGFEAGWGVSSYNWYLGVAATTQPVPIKMTFNRISITANNLTDKFTMYDYANGDLLGGFYVFKRVLLYLRGGGGVGQINFAQYNNTFGTRTFRDNNTGWLVRGGAGLDVPLGDYFSLGADYIYTQFERSDLTGISPIDGLRHSFSVTKPHTNYIGLHVRWLFGIPD